MKKIDFQIIKLVLKFLKLCGKFSDFFRLQNFKFPTSKKNKKYHFICEINNFHWKVIITTVLGIEIDGQRIDSFKMV